MRSSADVVICGAGIAGVAAAYHLAVRQGLRRVVIVDERDRVLVIRNGRDYPSVGMSRWRKQEARARHSGQLALTFITGDEGRRGAFVEFLRTVQATENSEGDTTDDTGTDRS